MMLEALLGGFGFEIAAGTPDKDACALIYHSDKTVPGSAFFAINGTERDGRSYMESAAQKGACLIVTERGGPETDGLLKRLSAQYGLTAVYTESTRKALAAASAEFYGRPADELMLIGVTGTKGKTTTTFMVKEILEAAGIKTGIIGTVVSGYDGCYEEASNTTPQSTDIHSALRKMADAGCRAAVIEVSSQGLMQERTFGLNFDSAIFTNIYPDHIGGREHKNFEDYIYWKSRLFKQTKTAIINRDDPHWGYIAGEREADRIVTFSTAGDTSADYIASDIRLMWQRDILGVSFNTRGLEFVLGMPGKFNAANALGAAACAETLGVDMSIAAKALADVRVRGRTEQVDLNEDFTVLVDYAHNGPALESLLSTLREYEPARLIPVFGCGGERDRNRRFEMGRCAAELADFTVVTSDNPRREKPMDIIRDIISAMAEEEGSYTVIPDRREAIRWTVSQAQTGDIIIIAGKGHETYQITGEEKRHFDDREEVLSAMGKI